ncbi:response regulator transcription factor [Roseburia sp. MUC/MUC-530-WT-4D]|mgnify:CR=1 FL=1|uniref:Stage 0 sporulation protein A homolog n=1 Tax=Roseburia porci TaxID=2605790 RepID=A0A6L5YQ39_9FIRM|nr:response regulator transcription factor [Roseburia porci]MDD6742294.1 response regulator transcription factor [Roseburia porci]MST74287.1 response regulator transcription factor [Roseburia porci]
MQQVLIVDDEEEIRNMLVKCLKREGISGIPCENGVKALEIVQHQKIDMVILDIMMADMDGFEVLRDIREYDNEIPVIFLSARQEEYDKVLGLGLGADDYVTKPFSPGELMARVKVQLRRKIKNVTSKPEKLVVGPLELDLGSLEVKVRGEKVELAGKELLILKFFMEHPHQVFTKSQIYHQVWNVDYEDDNTVMVYISHLREKIEEEPRKPKLLQTIRGIGYRLEAVNEK